VDAFGVAELSEAVAIKKYGVLTYILGAILPEEISAAIENDIVIPVSDLFTAQLVSDAATELGKVAQISILLDTGMGRLGMVGECVQEIRQIKGLPSLELDSIFSHFPVAYEDSVFSNRQVSDFLEFVSEFESESVGLHMANSDGINNVPLANKSPFTMVRCGINLYGVHDLIGKNSYHLQESIVLKSRLVAVRLLKKGSCVGYGQTYILKESMVIGTVAAGYADGVPLGASNRGVVKIHGKECPIVGRVSMDYITVDLSAVVGEAKVGDQVVLLGEGISVKDWALLSGSIPYQIICSFGNRVERVYL
jgi:alanine racemase